MAFANDTIEIAITAQDLTGSAFRSATEAINKFKGVADANSESLSKLSSIAGQARAAFGVLIASEVVQRAVAFHNEVSRQVGSLRDQADALGISTTQLQAYGTAFATAGYSEDIARNSVATFNAALNEATKGNKAYIDSFDQLGVKILDSTGKLRDPNAVLAETARQIAGLERGMQRTALSTQMFGQSGNQFAPVLRELGGGMSELVRKADEFGTISSPKAIEQFEELNRKSNLLSLQVRTLYGEFAAPIATEALDHFNKVLASTKQELELISGLWRFISGTRPLGDQLGALDKDIAAFRERGYGDDNPVMQDLLQRRAALQKKKDEEPPAKVLPTITVTAPGDHNPRATGNKSGSGGGSDRVGNALLRLQEERKALETAAGILSAGTELSQRELFKAADLQERIGTKTANLLKGLDPNSDTAKQIREAVTLLETLRTSVTDLRESIMLADETEARYGTGQKQHAETMTRLAQALDTGRLSQDAYNEAVKQANYALADQQLKAQGAKEGIEGLLAGMQYAAEQYRRSNSAFLTGQKLFNDGFEVFKTTVDDWSKTGVLNIEKFGQAMLNMLANVGWALAQSELTKLLAGGGSGGGGGAGGLFGWLGSVLGLGGGGATPAVDEGLGAAVAGIAGMKANGGPVTSGLPYIIGERGPELFIPDSSGTIIPNEALGSGGDSIVIHMPVSFGSDVSRAEMSRWANVVKQQAMEGAIAGVQAKRRRGGSMKTDFGR